MKIVKIILLILGWSSSFNSISQSTDLQYRSINIYHNTLVSLMNIEFGIDIGVEDFKLYPGSTAIGSSSTWMWNIYDAITNSAGVFYDPSQFNNFSQGYGTILHDMKTIPTESESCGLSNAIVKYSTAKVRVWNSTIERLKHSLDSGVNIKLIVDTTFKLPAEDVGDSIVSTIRISAYFDSLAVVCAFPYSKKDSNDSILKNFNPWFSPETFTCAYRNINNQFLSPENWKEYFGDNGFLNKICVGLVVAKKVMLNINAINANVTYTTNSKVNTPTLLGVILIPMDSFVNCIDGLYLLSFFK